MKSIGSMDNAIDIERHDNMNNGELHNKNHIKKK